MHCLRTYQELHAIPSHGVQKVAFSLDSLVLVGLVARPHSAQRSRADQDGMQVKDDVERCCSVSLLDAATGVCKLVSSVTQMTSTCGHAREHPVRMLDLPSCEQSASANHGQPILQATRLVLVPCWGALCVCEPLGDCLVVQQQLGPAKVLDLRSGQVGCR